MKVLAFDTSTKFLSIACLEDNDVLAEFHEDVGIRHSDILMSTIGETLKKISWDISEVELMCVGLGPGSFTGLRIGVATVKGLAAVLKNKVIGVPTMDAMVMNVSGKKGKAAPFLDARKGKIYTCIYDVTDERPKKTTEYLLVTANDFLSSLKEEILFFGDGIAKYKKELDTCSFAQYDESIDWYPKAANIGRIGLEKSHSGTDDPATIDPLYLHTKECNITSKTNKDPFFKIIGKSKGKKDGSVNHDKDIYGNKD